MNNLPCESYFILRIGERLGESVGFSWTSATAATSFRDDAAIRLNNVINAGKIQV